MSAKHLCIGGPANNQLLDFEQIRQYSGYEPYNDSNRHNRTKVGLARAKAVGRVVPPTHVYIHQSIFVNSPLFGAESP